jgi:drug/metabolite transporter (DMT)-like permease
MDGGQSESGAWQGAALGLAAASLFGISTPIAKLLLHRLVPLSLAAVLYLGCGLGLALFSLARRWLGGAKARDAAPGRSDWPWLLAGIFFGGVLGPILLLTGLARTGAATASLLLNLESVLTALIAWLVLREHVDRAIALGMAAIVAGAAVLSWPWSAGVPAAWDADGIAGPLAIMGACLAWALDNNLTRKVSLLDPVLIGMLKGFVAGGVNLALYLVLAAPSLPGGGLAAVPWAEILAGGLVGALGYGLSIVLFVLALRRIGAARTGAYYAFAPFIGATVAVAALGEPVTAQLMLAGGLMLAGLWPYLAERHGHEHSHTALAHAHRHRHDIHHRHDHAAADPPGEPHSHRHVHVPLRHSHRHFPDAHHSHGH